MKKEFIVSKIEASQDGSPYLYVMLTDTKANFTSTRRQQGFPENPFGVASDVADHEPDSDRPAARACRRADADGW